MLSNSKVGKQSNANGSNPVIRSSREGDLIVSENHGRYYQKTAEGEAFVISTPLTGLTLAATHTTATLTATSTPLITIFNGGTLNIAINREFIATLSGTPASGSYWWYVATGQQASALTLLTDTGINSRNLITDAPSGVKVGIGKALTGLVGSLVLYKPVGSLGTVTAGLGQVDHDEAGAVIVAPGNLIALLAPAIGTTHIVHASVDITRIEVSA
jgi:hypothetical protein